MPVKRVVIVHGHASHPDKYWFASLATSLRRGIQEVPIPRMPLPYLPLIPSWTNRLCEIVGDHPEETAIIGHSFGGIAAFYLADNLAYCRMLAAIVVIASPVKWVWHPSFPARVILFAREPDWKRVNIGARKILLVYSANDWITPINNATYLQNQLDNKALVLPNHGHFLASSLPDEVKVQIARTFGLNDQLLL